jgi:hypothetical protein
LDENFFEEAHETPCADAHEDGEKVTRAEVGKCARTHARMRARGWSPHVWIAALVSLGGVAGAAGLTGCAGADAAAPPPAFPPYTADDARLFDDAIDPRVLDVGYDAPRLAPRGDATLFERAQIGEGVVRGRIDSVTVKGSPDAPDYELGVRVIEPLGRNRTLGSEFAVRVDRTSPSFGLVRALLTRISGHTAIVFVRTYANESGAPTTHFHMVPDDPEVAAAVREATSLDRVPFSRDSGAPASSAAGLPAPASPPPSAPDVDRPVR